MTHDEELPDELLPDWLWEEVAPMLPARPPRPNGGRPPRDDRPRLLALLRILREGCAWRR